MKQLTFVILLSFLGAFHAFGQRDFYKKYTFTKADTLRGMLSPERTCYDVTFYDLNVAVDIPKKFIQGYVDILFDVTEDFETMQIDLYKNMTLLKINCYNKVLSYNRVGDAIFVHFPERQLAGTSIGIRVYFEGFPTEAQNAPWDGGFVWKKDEYGKPWVGVACEGDGASLWWPNKDHLSDEPDSVGIHVTIPKSLGLSVISNGNLRDTVENDGFVTWNWFVSYPINNYNVTLNIGDYAHFSIPYTAADGDVLPVDYYVLWYNLEKAKEHFKQVNGVLACYEKYFDKYPFWNDGLAFVETPYLGMEHQSAIAYGNKYMRGYLGGMIPRDMNWDFIIVHELGHEWFGNSISVNDHAEMWIHESFTTYMEALYVECTMDYENAIRYLENQKSFIVNREPIMGPMDVNFDNWSGSDHYFKGAWVLHTLRNAIHNDSLWFDILKNFYLEHKLSHVTTEDFIDFVNKKTGRDWHPFFEQYLYYTSLPKLLYLVEETPDGLAVQFKWDSEVPGFDMPVLMGKRGEWQLVYPSSEAVKTVVFPGLSKKDFDIPLDRFYIRKSRLP